VPAGVTVATHLTADGRGRAVDQAGDPAQAEALGMTDLNGGAFFNAEFGIGHRGNTVPERSGVALSFCGRLASKNSEVCSRPEIRGYFRPSIDLFFLDFSPLLLLV